MRGIPRPWKSCAGTAVRSTGRPAPLPLLLAITAHKPAAPYQLVIRDRAVGEYLVNSSAAPGTRRNSAGEVILPLRLQPSASPLAPEFIGTADAYQVNGRVLFLKVQGEQLTLEAFRTTQPTGGIYVQQEKITDWTFRGCK